jgi:hypothetical protein
LILDFWFSIANQEARQSKSKIINRKSEEEGPMRRLSFLLALGGLSLLAGCNTTKWNMFRGSGGNPPYAEAPSRDQLVYFLNDNAERVQSVQCGHLYVTCSQGPLRTVSLDGQMVCQKPRSFRMVARLGVSGTQELDMGSNDEEFWYWIARGDPYQFHCSYRALDEGTVRVNPLPIQPDWIIEAMGIAKCSPVENYTVVVKRDTVELVEKARSPQGRAVRKVTVFRRTRAGNGSPQVMAHLLVDEATNKEICSATISQAQQVITADGKAQVILPKKLVFSMPAAKTWITLTLDEVAVNKTVGRPDLLFTRRPLANIRSYNLAEGRVDGSIRQVEAQTR